MFSTILNFPWSSIMLCHCKNKQFCCCKQIFFNIPTADRYFSPELSHRKQRNGWEDILPDKNSKATSRVYLYNATFFFKVRDLFLNEIAKLRGNKPGIYLMN